MKPLLPAWEDFAASIRPQLEELRSIAKCAWGIACQVSHVPFGHDVGAIFEEPARDLAHRFEKVVGRPPAHDWATSVEIYALLDDCRRAFARFGIDIGGTPEPMPRPTIWTNRPEHYALADGGRTSPPRFVLVSGLKVGPDGSLED